jgi:hypothetical protein
MINNDYEVHALAGMKLEALNGNVALKGTFVELQSRLAFSTVTQAQIQSDLGLEMGVDAQHYAPVLDYLVTTNNAGEMLLNNGSSWQSKAPSDIRTALSLVPGTDVQVFSSVLDSVAMAAGTSGNFLIANGSGVTSTVPSAVVELLGLVPGTDVQAHSPILDSAAGINLTSGNVVTVDGTGFASVDPSTLLSAVGGQPLSSVLTDISTAGEPPAANNMLISSSTTSFEYLAVESEGKALIGCASASDAITTLELTDYSKSVSVDKIRSYSSQLTDSNNFGEYAHFSNSLQTTNTTTTSLVLMAIPDNSVKYFDITVVGKEISGASPRTIIRRYNFACSKAVGSNAIVLGSYNATSLVALGPGATANISVAVDTSVQSLRVSVIGESGKTWSWCSVSKIHTL